MTMPGITDAEHDAELLARADEKGEELLEALKERITCDIKDIGTLRKEMTITVPGDVIAERLANDFKEIRNDAVLPGFRKGRAPLSLVQKRFAGDVRKSLKTSIVGQSFFAAIEKNEIESLGDPLFRVDTDDGVKLLDLNEALAHIQLPEQGDFTYVCEVEVKPTFELPELKGIEIAAPQVEINDEMVDEQILRDRKIRGRYELSSEPAQAGDDLVIADVQLLVDGQKVNEEDNVELGVRPTRLDGIPLMNLGEVLSGARPGDEKTIECDIPDDYARPDLRGKKGEFRFKVHEVKRLAPASLETLLEQMGLESEQELRDLVRERLEDERESLVRREKRSQVLDYLLENTKLDLPEQLSARQTDRAVMRRVIELQQSGVPMAEVEAQIDDLRTGAREQVMRDLKLEFIMEKVAEQLEVTVTDEDVNAEIAGIARLYRQRFDRVRDDLARRGLLDQLAFQIRQDKCIERILADAKLVEKKEPAGEAPPKKKSSRKK
ncbi:MAG: trigger factor, partial [Planctomycetota bacterium]